MELPYPWNERRTGFGVAVVLPAFNAERTIGLAIRSALAEPEVVEVAVIDDASSDGTSRAARQADDGSGRLTVRRLKRNAGPAAARNLAIATTRAPILALLDSDDLFVPGRLSRLMAVQGWDIIADNVLFCPDGCDTRAVVEQVRHESAAGAETLLLSLETFVRGNINRRSRRRRELGLLHPLFRRQFLDEHGLRYDAPLRLGEDYDLYARALLAGARFRVHPMVGYVAIERADSLSGLHQTRDLERLCHVDEHLLDDGRVTPRERHAIGAHLRDVRRRHRLRAFLDLKREAGAAAALGHLAINPGAASSIVRDVWRDKWNAALARRGTAKPPTSTLLPPAALARLTGLSDREGLSF